MEHFKLIYQWIFTLLITTWLVTLSRGTSVSLVIIEGGVSLVGSFCPGTVRLFCEGVELTSLRWRYNGNINIISYSSDSTSAPQPTESAFFLTQLTAIAQNPNNLNFANYSSYLTVNLTQLESNNITEISCSDPGVSQVEPVNVTINDIKNPNNPNITMVTIAYQSGELDSLEVTWEKSDNSCSTSGLFYEVNLTDSILVNDSGDSCGEVLCVVSFNNITGTGKTKQFAVSIRAENELGTSDSVFYPTIITQQVQQYFIPQVFSKDGQLVGQCTLAQGIVGNAICTIQHTTDSMYRNVSNEITVPLDTEVLLLEAPVSGTTYYLQFTVLVNNTLQLTDRLVFRFSQADTGVPDWGIALIVVIVLIAVTALVVSAVVIFIMIQKKRSVKNKVPVANKSGMSMDLVGEDKQESSESQGASTNGLQQPDEAKQYCSVDTHRNKPTDKMVIAEMFDLPSQECIGGHITLSVIDHETRYECLLKPYTVYEIIVRRNNEQAVVFRQYNEFRELAKKIQERYGIRPSQLNFPEETRILWRKFNHDFIIYRLDALGKFLNKVMKIHAVDMSLIRDFLVTDDFKAEKDLVEQCHV